MDRKELLIYLSIILIVAFTAVYGTIIISNNSVLFPFTQNGKTGYMDVNGIIRIEPKFKYGYAFSEGLAVVAVTVNNNDKYGYINLKGNYVIKPQFRFAESFYYGYARVSTSKGKYIRFTNYINKKGKTVTPPKNYIQNLINSRGEGYKAVQDKKTNKYGYENSKGKLVIPCIYSTAGDFSDGLALVQNKKGTSFIDKKGKIVLTLPKNCISEDYFYHGLLHIRLDNGEWTYINKQGKIVNPHY